MIKKNESNLDQIKPHETQNKNNSLGLLRVTTETKNSISIELKLMGFDGNYVIIVIIVNMVEYMLCNYVNYS